MDKAAELKGNRINNVSLSETVLMLKLEDRVSKSTKKNLARFTTIFAYLCSVALPALILALYYTSFWKHDYSSATPAPLNGSTAPNQ